VSPFLVTEVIQVFPPRTSGSTFCGHKSSQLASPFFSCAGRTSPWSSPDCRRGFPGPLVPALSTIEQGDSSLFSSQNFVRALHASYQGKSLFFFVEPQAPAAFIPLHRPDTVKSVDSLPLFLRSAELRSSPHVGAPFFFRATGLKLLSRSCRPYFSFFRPSGGDSFFFDREVADFLPFCPGSTPALLPRSV